MSDQLYGLLYTWVNMVLNPLPLPVAQIPIIQAHQNAPQPTTGVYVVIGDIPNQNKRGRAHHANEVDASGKQMLRNDYECTMELWEVNGTGDLLRQLIDSIDIQAVHEYWTLKKISLKNHGNITSIPAVAENNWSKECMVELTIGVGIGTEDTVGKITDVEINGTVPAQGRPGAPHEVEL